MTNTDLPDDPISAESILETSDEPSDVSRDKESQSLEQRLASLERKVDSLSEVVAQLSTQQATKRKPSVSNNKTPEKRRTSKDRESRIRGALRLYWEAKLEGKPISLKAAATTDEYDLEPTALSKKYAMAYRKTIDDQWKKLGGYEGMKKNSGITRGKERFLQFIYRTLHGSPAIQR